MHKVNCSLLSFITISLFGSGIRNANLFNWLGKFGCMFENSIISQLMN